MSLTELIRLKDLHVHEGRKADESTLAAVQAIAALVRGRKSK